MAPLMVRTAAALYVDPQGSYFGMLAVDRQGVQPYSPNDRDSAGGVLKDAVAVIKIERASYRAEETK